MTEAWAGRMELEFIRTWMVVKKLFSESVYEETARGGERMKNGTQRGLGRIGQRGGRRKWAVTGDGSVRGHRREWSADREGEN